MSTYPDDPAGVGRRPRRRGRPPRISRDAIVSAAIAQGLDSFSMQGIADHLGVTTPALYSHVGGRDDVLDLVRAALVARIGSFESTATDWRSWLEDFADLVRVTLAPSATAVMGDLRTPGTVGHIHVGERGLTLLMEAGLSPVEASFCVWLVFRVAITAGPAGEPSFSGFVGDTAHLLAPAGEALPATAAVHAALVADERLDTFAFDLDAVLDGIAHRIARPHRTDAS